MEHLPIRLLRWLCPTEQFKSPGPECRNALGRRGAESKNPKGQLVNLKESKDLKILERPTSLNKFVLTQDGNMVVGNIDKSVPPKWMSHPSIAEIGAGPGQSQNVVSAGYMKKNLMGKVQLSNTSGHYLPSKSDLRPAQQHLRNMGTESTKSECVIA